MKRFSFLLTLGLAATAAGAVLAGGNDEAETLTKISGYRSWTRVNAKPVEVPVSINLATATISSIDFSNVAV